MSASDIEWTDEVWNPTTGCDRISEECDRCYALAFAARLKGMGKPAYQRDGDPRTSGPGFGLTLHPDRLEVPLRWRKPRRVFVDSMSDLFHRDVPARFRDQVMATMAWARPHTFQVLTKRAKAMRRYLTDPTLERRLEDAVCSRCIARGGALCGCGNDDCDMGDVAYLPLPNVWLGTSVGQAKTEFRLEHLRETPAAVRWVSAEPIIGPPSDRLDLTGVDWVVVGGESGAGARTLDLDWAREWVAAARTFGAQVFVKQLGAGFAREHGGPAKGGDPSFWPEELRVREMPLPQAFRPPA